MLKTLPDDAILIPDNAEVVFSGKIFDVYQWPQMLFEGSVATFEMLKRPDTVQVIVEDKGKLILIDDEQPGRASHVHFPGGRVDPEDSSWLEAAKRELKEETGIECKEWKLIAVVQPQPKIEWFVPWYLATDVTNRGVQSTDDGGEKIEVLERGFNEVRGSVLGGQEPTMQYATSIFLRCKSVEELLALPEYKGQETDR